jgi:hypothetical protein
MASIRYLTVLVLLTLAAGLLVSCVPIPPYDPVLAGKGVDVQQEGAAMPAPTATAAAPLAQAEFTSTPEAFTQVEPTATPAELAPVKPTSTPVTLAQAEVASAPVTVTITLANPSDAQAMVALTPTDAPVPTSMPTASFTASPAPTFTPRPTSTAAATPMRAITSTPAPTPTATVDRHLIIITEDDIAKAVAGGAGAQQSVTLENLKVRFAGGKTHITADRLGYSFINLQNLDLVGSLAAQNGVLSLAVESISPRGLAANFVPGAVNQALANYASQWYVEEVRTLDGRVELRIR